MMSKRQQLLDAVNNSPGDAKSYRDLASDMCENETVTLFGANMTKRTLLVKSLALDPTQAATFNDLGSSCVLATETVTLEDGSKTSKRDCFLKAIELNPTHAVYFRNLAVCLRDQEAVKMPHGASMTKRGLLLRAIELNPSHGTPFADLANMLRPAEIVKLRDGTEMTRRELFLKALQVDSTGYKGWVHRAFGNTLQPDEKVTLPDGSEVTKEMLKKLGDYYGGELDLTEGVGSFDSSTKFSPAVGDLERRAFSLMYIQVHPDVFQRKLLLDGRNSNIAEQLKQRSTATTIVVTGADVEALSLTRGKFTSSSFQVLEVRDCKHEHAKHVATLFSKRNVFNLDRLCYLRVVVANDENARAGAEIARLCPKNVFAIEFCTPTGSTMQTSSYDIILSVAANNTLFVRHFVVDTDAPTGANAATTIQAARKNRAIEFTLRKEQRTDDGTTFLERNANERFADSFDFELPPIVSFRDFKWGDVFGLFSSTGLVQCDFKDLRKHSVMLQAMYTERQRTTPLVKCCENNVGVRTVAVQLVVLYVSAKDKNGKPLFASEEVTEEAGKHPNVWHLSLTDEVFLKFAAGKSKDTKDEVSLCTEILGIATFLHMPALQRLIFSHLVRMWKTEKVEELKTEHERKRGRM